MHVLIYIKPGCDYCMDAMDWFAARGIEYALVNATTPHEQNQIKARLTREHKINITTFPQIFVDGEYIGDGKIIAAEFINQGERYTAIRHTDGNFYTPEGRSMKKAFLRAPVNFKYISSSFNPRRLHPVTKTVKPHNGIDYAARTGTPVVSSGNGKVIRAGYSKYNGNYVFISHGTQ